MVNDGGSGKNGGNTGNPKEGIIEGGGGSMEGGGGSIEGGGGSMAKTGGSGKSEEEGGDESIMEEDLFLNELLLLLSLRLTLRVSRWSFARYSTLHWKFTCVCDWHTLHGAKHISTLCPSRPQFEQGALLSPH